MVSRASRLTLLDETGIAFRDAHWQEDLRSWLARGADGKPHTFDVEVDRVRHWAAGDLAAGPSSGSYPAKGMLIVPPRRPVWPEWRSGFRRICCSGPRA